MDAEHAIELIKLLKQHGLEVYVDGGWAVDALLGHQTRAHLDLDIAIRHKQVPRLRELLAAKGYQERNRDDTRECNFVLRDGGGHELDVHSYELDDAGNNIYGVEYRREHLQGRGVIHGCAVACISPEWLVRFHSGYELDENDYRDVKALCERFGFALPEEYRKFVK